MHACDIGRAVPVSRPDLPPFAQALVELSVSGRAFGFFLSPSLAPLPRLLRTAAGRFPPCAASPRTGTGLRMSRATATAVLSEMATGRLARSFPFGRGPCAGGAHGT